MMAVGMLIRGLVELYFTYEASYHTIAAIQHEQAQAASIHIQSFLDEIVRPMAALPIRPTDSSTLDDRREDHVRLLRQLSAATNLAYLDAAGTEQLRVSRVSGTSVRATGGPALAIMPAELTPGTPFFSRTYFLEGSEPYMTVARRGSDGGATVADVNLKLVWDIVEHIQVGERGYAYVVDRNGALIAHPDLSLVLRRTDATSLPQVREAIAEGTRLTQNAVIGNDIAGGQVLASFASVAGPEWIVVVERPLGEAFGPLYASVVRTALTVLGGIGVSLFFSWRGGRQPRAPDLERTVGT
jgi:two-component system NtrC family sensor kinase